MIFNDVPTIEMDVDESYYFLALCLGCSLSCPSCCFPELTVLTDLEGVDEGVVIEFLKKSKFTERFVIGGGEPTEQDGFLEFLQEIKEIGFYIELMTAGTRPNIIKECIDRELVDRYSVSYKAPFTKYLSATGHKPVGMAVLRSIKLVASSGFDYEIVTYAHKRMHSFGDFPEMRKELDGIGVCEWTIRPFCCQNPLDPSMNPCRAYTIEELQGIASQLPDVIIEL